MQATSTWTLCGRKGWDGVRRLDKRELHWHEREKHANMEPWCQCNLTHYHRTSPLAESID